MFSRFDARDEVFQESETSRGGLEWLSRLRSLDGLFRKLIMWAFMFCVLGVIATNLVAGPAR